MELNNNNNLNNKKNIEEIIQNIFKIISTLTYGFIDKNNKTHKKTKKEFYFENYRLQTPEETLKYKYGTCWDQVELVRYLLEKENIKCDTYLINYNEENKIAKHTFVVVNENNFVYCVEYYFVQKGLNMKFNSVEDILKYFLGIFPNMFKIKDFDMNKIEIYKYNKPTKFGLKFFEFVDYCRTQEKIETINLNIEKK